MNAVVGWVLAALALAAGWRSYGWPGVALGVTLVAFWLVLQFSRSLRVMRTAGGSPVGRVPSAVMFNARLRPGLQMMAVLALTKSLGRRLEGTAAGTAEEVFGWADDGGVEVVANFRGGRLLRWELRRPPDAAE